MFLLFIVFNMVDCWKPRFLISDRIFTDFLQTTKSLRMKLHTSSLLKYDSTSGTKISIMFEKKMGDDPVDRNKHL